MKSLLAVLIAITAPLFGQLGELRPDSAHAGLYFPHIADGGTVDGQWQTRITILNPSPSAVTVNIRFFRDDGTPWALDFGFGPATQASIALPPGGSQTLTSRVHSPTTQTGWAFGSANVPVQATIAFRLLQKGIAKQELTAPPTLPSLEYYSFANSFLGVAIANVYDSVITLTLEVFDSGGNSVGQQAVTLPPLGHISFNLRDKFPNLTAAFTGSLRIEHAPLGDQVSFIAWTVFADTSGVISTLPPGRLAWPISHYDQIWEAFLKIWDRAALVQFGNSSFGTVAPNLNIVQSHNGQAINAFGDANSITVTYGISELISDSPSELAFVIGHEMGHVFQGRNGGLQVWNPTDAEFDADSWGFILALLAGYDPYGGAGALAKLAMATGTAGLVQQFEAELSADAHKSFNTRLANIYNTINTVCTALPAECSNIKGLVHPDFPRSVQLRQIRPSN